MSDLKPCPCCDGTADFRRVTEEGTNFDGAYVICTHCGISTGLVFSCMDDAKPQLVELWNRRPISASEAVSEEQPVAWKRKDGAVAPSDVIANFRKNERWKDHAALYSTPLYTRPVTAAQIVERCARVCDERGLKHAAEEIRALSPAPQRVVVPDALSDVAAERRRQIDEEGWTPDHDDEHGNGAMALAGACYALHHASQCGPRNEYWRAIYASEATHLWPWDSEWWKPKDQRRDLVRAAALIIAEIERLDRKAMLSAAKSGSGE